MISTTNTVANVDGRATQNPEGSGDALPQQEPHREGPSPREIADFNRGEGPEPVMPPVPPGIVTDYPVLEGHFLETWDREPDPPHARTRSLARIVNFLGVDRLTGTLSQDALAGFVLTFRNNTIYTDEYEYRGVWHPPLECRETQDVCSLNNWTREVVDSYILGLDSMVRHAFKTPFLPTDLSHLLEPEFHDYCEYRCLTNMETILRAEVHKMEHAMHRYGIRANVRTLQAGCRILSSRLMLILCMALQAPGAQAAHIDLPSWPEVTTRVVASLGWLLHWIAMFVDRVADFLATTHTCTSRAEYLSVDSISQFCADGSVDPMTCDTIMKSSLWTDPFRDAHFVVPVEICRSGQDFGHLYQFKAWVFWIVFFTAAFFAICSLSSLARTLFLFARSATRSFFNLRSRLWDRLHFRSNICVVKRATEDMIGAPDAAEMKPVYRMLGVAATSFDSLEMSMAGSEIRTSSSVPGCVQLVMVVDKEVLFVGMGFRYEGYLVTAHHNVNAMSSTPGKCYIVPFKPNREKTLCKLDMDSMLEFSEEMMSRDIVAARYAGFDASVIPISDTDWSRLGVQALKHADAIWNTGVTAYGLEKSGKRCLQRSLGTIVKGDDHELTDVFYTASTLKGWSGSPVLSGHKRVVALHCGTNGQLNRGLNFAFIRFFIDVHESGGLESNMPETKKYLKSFRGRNGRLAMKRELLELERLEDEAHDLAGKVFVNRASNGLIWMSDSQEDPSPFRPPTTEMRWEDECALSTTQQEPRVVGETSIEAPRSPRKNDVFAFATNAPFAVEKTKQFVSAPFYKGLPEDHLAYIDMKEAKRLGYDPEAYLMPLAVDRETANERAKGSLSKNLAEAVKIRTDFDPPTLSIRAEAKMILMDILAPLRYVTDCSGVTKEKIRDQLNSSAVSSSKSPGLPYVLEGHTTNADVIKAYGLEELVEQIYNSYVNDTWCVDTVNFLKIEATKKSKLDAGEDRTVQSCGLGAQIIMRCFFGELMDSMVAGSRKGPLAAGWSPLKPGDGKFLYDKIAKKGNLACEWDGIKFEFTAHTEEIYPDVTDCMVGLAIPNSKTPPDVMRAWRKEAAVVMEKMGRAGYHCADGTVIKKLVALALNSGRFDTYARNTFTGYFWFIIACRSIGLSADEIKAVIAWFGGDDVVLSIRPDFDWEKLIGALRSYGMQIHKIRISKPEDGFEFFSWHFQKKDGMVTWVPTRFTKHVETFINTKHEHRSDALVAHMLNWVHSPEHFEFWRNIYMDGHDDIPQEYPLACLPDREQLVMHLQGYESLVRDPELVEAFAETALNYSSENGDGNIAR